MYVPRTATGRHGVGIDGGRYTDIKGAAVAPGRITSLTVLIDKAGEYTIFDSYRSNRQKGFATKFIAVKKAPARIPGRRCPGWTRLHVKAVKCKPASQIASIAQSRFEDSEFGRVNTTVRRFKCFVDLFAPTGTLTTCRNGDRQIRFQF